MFNNIRRFSFVFVCFLLLGIMASCKGSNASKNVNLSTDEIYEKIISGVDIPKLEKLGDSEIGSLMAIASSSYDEATFCLSPLNVQATEIALFKFSTKEQEDLIDKGITRRLEDLDVTWSRYLPDQYELIKNVKKFSDRNIKGYIIADNAVTIFENLIKVVNNAN